MRNFRILPKRRPRHPGDRGLQASMRIRAPRDGSEERHADLVIGASSGYAFADIRPWIESLERTGYRGGRAVIAYDMAFDDVDELLRRGIHVATFAEDGRRRRFVYPEKGFTHDDSSIDRFYKLWCYLSDRPVERFVIAADVRDVIFQLDPAGWLEANLGEMQLNVGSEGIPLAEEPWNSEVMSASFGTRIHEQLGSRDVYNAGTIAGRADALRDFALNVFLCSRHNLIQYTDQPAANVLLSLDPYRQITRFNGPDDDWACQAATFVGESEYLADRRRSGDRPRPKLVDGIVLTPDNRPYCLVHQYDRVPAWRDALMKRYAD
jgi:hypothetical protein